MKKLVSLLIALFVFTNLSAQDLYKADSRLSECLGNEFISQLESSRSDLIPYYNYYLDNSYYVVKLNSLEKEVTGTDIHTVLKQSKNPNEKVYFSEKTYTKEKFNPLNYNFNLSSNSFTTYIWKEAGIAIIFYPLSHISADFKDYMKNQNN